MNSSAMNAMEIKSRGQRVFEIEIHGLNFVKSRLGESFVRASQLIAQCQGKVVTTGIGKSGYIARKFAATMSSTGTPAVYLHPAESSHGDLGIITSADVVVAISYGGEAGEMNSILSFCARKKITLIALTGNLESTLAKNATEALDIKVPEEACPLKLAPTASSTAALVMCDAVAMCVLEIKGFQSKDFAEFHPGGNLGARLLTKVRDVMHSGDAIPLVNLRTPVKEVISHMTHKDVRGAAGVLDQDAQLVGVVTDGDLRRRLDKMMNPLDGVAEDIMSVNPRTIDAEELAEKALFMMEEFKIQMLFVLDKSAAQSRKPVGILHIQDLLKAKIR